MRLKKVEMIGFKSFMDRTVLDFRDGITTILGHNGCGKSNVVDAVRWVLGEQSAKQLRGEKMEDVIFKGTGKRKALSMAEVSLVFDNTAGVLSVPYTDVAITRKVTRTGTSDYYLNKVPCRLKDIRDLFYDTGVGNNAYSVIEQEVVGQVLDPHEKKVRSILEEGSGIVRYKVKRKEALRKLDLTQRDLLRVEDIIDEIGRQVRSLARQVGKARRHQKLFSEVKALELLRASKRVAEHTLELKGLQDQVQQLRTEGSGDDAELSQRRAELENMRPELDGLDSQRKEKSYELSQVENQLSQVEGELLVLREKIESGGRRMVEILEEVARCRDRSVELEAEAGEANREQAGLKERVAELKADMESRQAIARQVSDGYESIRTALADAQQLTLGFLKEEAEQKTEITAAETKFNSLQEQQGKLGQALRESEEREASIQQELAEAQSRADDLVHQQTELEGEAEEANEGVRLAEDRLQAAHDARSEAGDELARAESRLEIATRIAAEFEGYRAGTAALLNDVETRDRVHGALAEQLQIESGYESAFELVFGEDADALLVDSVDDARSLARRLAEGDLGQTSFLIRSHGSNGDSDDGHDLPGRPALDFVRADGAAYTLARRWLRSVRVVGSVDEAAQAAVHYAGRGVSFLAREGLFVRADGLVRGGTGARRELSLFGRTEQIEHLTTSVEQAQALLEARTSEQERSREHRDEARTIVANLERRSREIHGELRSAQEEVTGKRTALTREEEARRQVLTQRDETTRSIEQLVREIESLKTQLGLHGADQEASHMRVGDLSAELTRLEADREQAHDSLAEARLKLAHDQGLERELESRHQRLEVMLEDLRQRLARLESERATLEEDSERWQASKVEREESLSGLFEDRDTRREALRSLQESIDEKRVAMEAVQETIGEINERQRRKADALGALETRCTKIELTVQNIAERIQEKFQISVEEGVTQIADEALPSELVRGEDGVFQVNQVEELLAERQEKLDKLGPVNFVALDEYEEKKLRLEFLEKQRDDLLSSKEDLMQAINTINKTARKQFQATFDQVRENFQRLFATLFEGGKADLELVRSDDPLEGDVVISAQPKGKKVDNVALLSGGERALTAIAFLFAVYLIKPSPFCLLDEVDAPLDDVNVGRFVRLLSEFDTKTQFIVITHNKLTMEAADHLYGVTMEENGVSRLVSVSFEELGAEDPLGALERGAGRTARKGGARTTDAGELLGVTEDLVDGSAGEATMAKGAVAESEA